MWFAIGVQTYGSDFFCRLREHLLVEGVAAHPLPYIQAWTNDLAKRQTTMQHITMP